jgi:polysaccharide export outer membrane protein
VKPRLRVFGLLAAAVFAAGPSALSQTKQSEPGKEPAARGANSLPPRGQDSPAVAVDPNKYVIGPEDVLYVQVWRENDFTRQVVVRPDGRITMPLIGELQAGGLTPQQLTGSIKEQLTKYINSPDVSISVQEVRSKKYYMDGEVLKPGPYALITPTTVLEAISAAGGFRDFANQKDIHILRGVKIIMKFNYKDVTKGKHTDENIYLENGDHIVVR